MGIRIEECRVSMVDVARVWQKFGRCATNIAKVRQECCKGSFLSCTCKTINPKKTCG